MTSPPAHFPVIVVGAGPTGLVLANLLGTNGIRTLLIERNPGTVAEPRAVSIDDESLRTLQAAGLAEAAASKAILGYGSHYYSPAGRIFARVQPATWEYGYPRRSAFRQPVLEAQLRLGLARFPHVEVRFEHRLEWFEQSADRVQVRVRRPDASETTIDCDYLIGCDGARSAVRELLGIPMDGSTFSQRWLIVDMLGTPDRFRHTRVYCDPARPAIALPGPDGTRRYEFMLHPGESEAELLQVDTIRRMVAQRIPADRDLEIARKVVYTFHARIARRWRDKRVFLAGDAAHLSPPFAGQGMNSGVRDSLNLAWKLAAVLRGDLGPALLDSYQAERKPHAWALIEMALTLGRFMMPTGRVQAYLMQNLLRLLSLYPPSRDYVMHMKFKPKPRYQSGFVIAEGRARPEPVSGRLFPQPVVELADGRKLRLDDALGKGFALLVFGPDPAEPMRNLVLPAALSARFFSVVRQDYNFPFPDGPEPGWTLLRDCEGGIEAALRPHAPCAVLLRPDRYALAVVPLGSPAPVLRTLNTLVEATHVP